MVTIQTPHFPAVSAPRQTGHEQWPRGPCDEAAVTQVPFLPPTLTRTFKCISDISLPSLVYPTLSPIKDLVTGSLCISLGKIGPMTPHHLFSGTCD